MPNVLETLDQLKKKKPFKREKDYRPYLDNQGSSKIEEAPSSTEKQKVEKNIKETVVHSSVKKEGVPAPKAKSTPVQSEVSTHSEPTPKVNTHLNTQKTEMSTYVSTQTEQTAEIPHFVDRETRIVALDGEKRPVLNRKHVLVLQFLRNCLAKDNETKLIYHSQISKGLQIPVASVRRYLSELKNLKVIQNTRRGWHNGFQGNFYHLDLLKVKEVCSLAEAFQMQRSDWSQRSANSEFENPHMSTHVNTQMNTFSSSSNLNNKTTTTKHAQIDLSGIDLEAFPNFDRSRLIEIIGKYPTVESLQDFVDRVEFAIKEKMGTSNAIRDPNAFLFKAFQTGVNVGAGYKSRAVRFEEDALKREKEKLEALEKINDEKRKLELRRARMDFESWLADGGKPLKDQIERERKQQFVKSGFDVPPAQQLKQFKEIAVTQYLLKAEFPVTFKEDLLQTQNQSYIEQ